MNLVVNEDNKIADGDKVITTVLIPQHNYRVRHIAERQTFNKSVTITVVV